MCCKCEAVDDLSVDCKQCWAYLRFWAKDPVGKFIDNLRQSRLFADKICVTSHDSRAYDAQFLLRKFLKLRWTPQMIMGGTKILGMVVENLHSLDSLNCLPMSLKCMPKSFGWNCDSLPKGVHFHQFKKTNFWMHSMPASILWHRAGCRPRALPYCGNLVLLLLVPFQKLGLLIAWHAVCPVEIGFRIRAHIVQILGLLKHWG